MAILSVLFCMGAAMLFDDAIEQNIADSVDNVQIMAITIVFIYVVPRKSFCGAQSTSDQPFVLSIGAYAAIIFLPCLLKLEAPVSPCVAFARISSTD